MQQAELQHYTTQDSNGEKEKWPESLLYAHSKSLRAYEHSQGREVNKNLPFF